jgi:hypothetical protein
VDPSCETEPILRLQIADFRNGTGKLASASGGAVGLRIERRAATGRLPCGLPPRTRRGPIVQNEPNFRSAGGWGRPIVRNKPNLPPDRQAGPRLERIVRNKPNSPRVAGNGRGSPGPGGPRQGATVRNKPNLARVPRGGGKWPRPGGPAVEQLCETNPICPWTGRQGRGWTEWRKTPGQPDA